MANCKLCGGADPFEATGICATCSVKLGVRPMPPSRRPALPCMRCNATRFIRCVPREFTVAAGQDWNVSEIGPMTLTHPVHISSTFFGGRDVKPAEIGYGRGVLETYTCIKCGFVEWYCQDPEKVPIGPEYMTEAIDVAPSGEPYR